MHHPTAAARDDAAQAACDVLARLRGGCPGVHCITNAVAQNFTANVLLAAGCLPSMTVSPEEIGSFVARTQALLVNLGTFDSERHKATMIAVESATRHDRPWVLDPVFVDRAPPRAALAIDLVARGPAVLRLNHAEFFALAGKEPSAAAATNYAKSNKLVVGLSGQTDLVTDGERTAFVANGHPLMAKVTAMGCAGSALVAACLAVERDPIRAAIAALAITGVAGELAAERSDGPGSFAAAFLDALYNLDRSTLIARARIS